MTRTVPAVGACMLGALVGAAVWVPTRWRDREWDVEEWATDTQPIWFEVVAREPWEGKGTVALGRWRFGEFRPGRFGESYPDWGWQWVWDRGAYYTIDHWAGAQRKTDPRGPVVEEQVVIWPIVVTEQLLVLLVGGGLLAWAVRRERVRRAHLD